MFVLKKESAVKLRNAIGGKKEEPTLITVSWMNTQRSLPLPYPRKSLNFTYFSHNYYNYSMLQDISECSGMFHVPGFFDGPRYIPQENDAL